jgi:hypothetical protein
MKVIVEATKTRTGYDVMSKNGIFFLRDDEVEIINKAGSTQENTMSEIKFTESQFIELYYRCGSMTYRDFLDDAKERGWIVKDDIEQAIKDANEFYEYQYELAGQYFDKAVVIELSEKYMKAIELLQNKIKELEK